MPSDTIFALSSGAPPAAIAIVRISGPLADEALAAMCGNLPDPRHATLRALKDQAGDLLDRALCLWFPGPATVTGENLAELHLHGGKSVVDAILGALGTMPGLRQATPGEFTRRAFANGIIDLTEAEGLGDLLSAETDLQRRSALALANGGLSVQVERWRAQLLGLSAQVESALDFSDEGDVAFDDGFWREAIGELRRDIDDWLARPSSEILRQGLRVTIAGPPNAGKSTLFNALIDRDQAIVTPLPGTTRDVLEQTIAMEGIAFTFVDTAGLRDTPGDPVEAIGIERGRLEMARADLVLALDGPINDSDAEQWMVQSRIDRTDVEVAADVDFAISPVSGEGMSDLRRALVKYGRRHLPAPGATALNERHSILLSHVADALDRASVAADLLVKGEELRVARLSFDKLTGRVGTEDLLDHLFSSFCIGK